MGPKWVPIASRTSAVTDRPHVARTATSSRRRKPDSESGFPRWIAAVSDAPRSVFEPADEWPLVYRVLARSRPGNPFDHQDRTQERTVDEHTQRQRAHLVVVGSNSDLEPSRRRKPESRTSARAPRQPTALPRVPVEPLLGARHDGRERMPTAAELGEGYARLVDRLAADEPLLRRFLAAAWSEADRRADAERPWAELSASLQACREALERDSPDQVDAFSKWAQGRMDARGMWEWPFVDGSPLDAEQHFILLVSSFAKTHVIQRALKLRSLEAVQKRIKRLTDHGVDDAYLAGISLVTVAELALRADGHGDLLERAFFLLEENVFRFELAVLEFTLSGDTDVVAVCERVRKQPDVARVRYQ